MKNELMNVGLNVLSDNYILENLQTVEDCLKKLKDIDKSLEQLEEKLALQQEENNEISVKGTTEFMGIEIPNIYGGFGEGKKAITDKHIAEVHGMRTVNVRQRINENRPRFKDGIDIIDFMDGKGTVREPYSKEMLKQLGYTDVAIRNADHIYLLSERGYAKLIKIMDTDLAWDIHDKLIDEYFQMKEMIKNGNLPSYQIEDEETRAFAWIRERNKEKYEKLKLFRKAVEERMEKLILEGDIEDRERIINDLLYNVDLAEKRQRVNQIVKYGNEDVVSRWRLLYGEFNLKYHKDVYRCAKNRGIKVIEYIDQIGMMEELYELAVKLFRTDVDELLDCWKSTIESSRKGR